MYLQYLCEIYLFGTNRSSQVYEKFCVKEVFKCYEGRWWKKIKECQKLKLGDAPVTPKKYSRRLKRLSLGMPPCIPFFINNYQFVLPSSIFLLLHMLCALLGASCSLVFSFVFLVLLCLLVITSWVLACFVLERDTLHSCLECSYFHFYLLSVQFSVSSCCLYV